VVSVAGRWRNGLRIKVREGRVLFARHPATGIIGVLDEVACCFGLARNLAERVVLVGDDRACRSVRAGAIVNKDIVASLGETSPEMVVGEVGNAIVGVVGCNARK